MSRHGRQRPLPLFHGGIAGLRVGDLVRPAPPHVVDGCPIWQPMDPPSSRSAVYVTTDLPYARFYAARSQGDLYQVEPSGMVLPEEDARTALLIPSAEDHFPTWTCVEAVVVAVVARGVQLTKHDRRRMLSRWKAADMAADAAGKVTT